MLHGLGGTSNTWTALDAGVRAHDAHPLRSAGLGTLGSRRRARFRSTRFVEAALRALAAAGVERAHVVAHSMGTIVAAHLAALHPDGRAQPRAVRSAARAAGPGAREPARARRRRRAAKACRHAGDRRRAGAGGDVVVDEAAAPRGGRVRARVADAPAARRLCAQLRRARRRAAAPTPRTSRARRCSSPATRTRSRRPQAVRQMGEQHRSRRRARAGRSAARLRALDAGRDARRMLATCCAASLRAAHALEEIMPWATCCSPTCASSTASGAAPFAGEVLVQGNRIARVGRGARSLPTADATVIDARRRDAHARHGRGAHALLVERCGDARRDPAHAARGARAVVGATSRSAISRPASPPASAPRARRRGSTSSRATRSTKA